jgi:hypothetical protein
MNPKRKTQSSSVNERKKAEKNQLKWTVFYNTQSTLESRTSKVGPLAHIARYPYVSFFLKKRINRKEQQKKIEANVFFFFFLPCREDCDVGSAILLSFKIMSVEPQSILQN